MFDTWGKYERLKALRDRHVKNIDKYFYGMGAILAALAMLLFLLGGKSVSHDIMINQRLGWQRLRLGMIIFFVLLSLFIVGMSVFTILVTVRRGWPWMFPMVYAVLVLFFGAIPLMAEGNAILSFSSVSNETIEVLCDLNPKELRQMTSRYTYKMFESAH